MITELPSRNEKKTLFFMPNLFFFWLIHVTLNIKNVTKFSRLLIINYNVLQIIITKMSKEVVMQKAIFVKTQSTENTRKRETYIKPKPLPLPPWSSNNYTKASQLARTLFFDILFLDVNLYQNIDIERNINFCWKYQNLDPQKSETSCKLLPYEEHTSCSIRLHSSKKIHDHGMLGCWSCHCRWTPAYWNYTMKVLNRLYLV